MRQADYIVDVGPGAGVHGGEIVGRGQCGRHLQCTAQSDRRVSFRPQHLSEAYHRPPLRITVQMYGGQARENNLQNIDVIFPPWPK